ncbi:hypothetical protein Tco_1503010 [Tanacetum coccineum]
MGTPQHYLNSQNPNPTRYDTSRVQPIIWAPEQTHPKNTLMVVDTQGLNQDILKEHVENVRLIRSWHSGSKRGSKVMENWSHVPSRSIQWDTFIPSYDSIVITTMIASYTVSRIYMDENRSVDIMCGHCISKLPGNIRSRLMPPTTPLIGFSGERSYPEGVVYLALTVGSYPLSMTIMLHFHIVKSTSKYNVILRRIAIQKHSKDVSIIESVINFPIEAGIVIVRSNYPDKDAILATTVEESNIR